MEFPVELEIVVPGTTPESEAAGRQAAGVYETYLVA